MHNGKFKILHLGDIHLGREFSLEGVVGSAFSLRREEIWKTFEMALEFAKNSDVKIVLIPGDLYENDSMSLSNLDRLNYLFEKYGDINFVISLGNHDHISVKSEYLASNSPKNVYIFSESLEYVEIEQKVRIYGFSWSKVEYEYFEIPEVSLDDNYINILSIHGTNSPANNYLPLDIPKLESWGFDYIALGHIHKPGRIGEKTYYSGSIEPLSFSDIGERGGFLIDFTNGNHMVNFVNFASRQYRILEVDVTGIVNNIELYACVEELIKNIDEKDFLKINFFGKHNNLELEQLNNIFGQRFFYFELVDLTTSLIDVDVLLYENKNNLLGKYLTHVLENYSGKEQEKLINIGIEVFPWREEFEA
ncbi:MAG: DNA repair exonuclease [Tissierellia bacterium]|nr:DNA repair exonuclease [Tissierellia bacterium]